MSAPMSQIHICENVYIDNNYVNTIYFENAAAQLAYFAGKVVKTFSAFSYLRKSWPLRVQATMGQASGWTYLYFKNPDNAKYYYYFITNIEYISNSTVELTLELDVMQTYHFEMNLKKSFIVRQHAVSDSIGEHTLEEDVECGELDCYYATGLNFNELCIIMQSTVDPINTSDGNRVDARSRVYDGVWSGMGLWAIDMGSTSALASTLANFEEWGYIDGIQSMWVYPKAFVQTADDWADGSTFHVVTGYGEQNMELPNGFNNADIFQGYVPRNNKLYTFPFNMLNVSNSAGASAIYRFERFNENSDTHGKPEFRYFGALAADASLKAVPRNYNGLVTNYEEGVTAAGYPTCAWDADGYKIWLAQNQNTRTVGMVSAGVSAGLGVVGAIASGDVMGGINSAVSGASQIASLVAQKRDMQVQPPQARGAYSASVNVAAGYPNFCFYYKALNREHAEVADCYFDMYGYKVNKYGIPIRKARQNYTYVQTIDCVVGGNLCHEDKQAIAAIFNKGVTFWTNGDNIGNYGINPTL